MEITKRTMGKCTVLDCIGELIIGPSAEAFRKAIHEAVQEGSSKVVLNLNNVSRMDSSGLSELINGYIHAKNNGSKLVLLNLSKKIQMLIEITKTEILFEFFNDEQKAREGCE